MREYSFNEESIILETKTSGILKIEDIINHYDEIARDDTLPRNLKVLIDTRGTQFDVKMNEMSLATNTVKNVLQKYNYIKEAILVDKPSTTVVAMLFEINSTGFESYNFQVFSTENAARNWLE